MPKLKEMIGTDIKWDGDFVKESGGGDLESISGLDNIHQRLFHRLITVPGTVIHRPDYGVGVKSFQNAVASIRNKRDLAIRIQDQFPQDPDIESVEGVKLSSSDLSPEKTVLTVRAKIRGYGETSLEFIPFGEG